MTAVPVGRREGVAASRWFVAEVPQGRTFKSAEGIY